MRVVTLGEHFALALWVCLVSSLGAEARIKVHTWVDDQTVYTIREKPIIMNIDSPSKGILMLANPLNACGPLSPAPPPMNATWTLMTGLNVSTSNEATIELEGFTWILMVSWEENDACSLRVKAENAAAAGYTVMLLQDPSNFDNDSEPLSPLLTPLSSTGGFDYGWSDENVYACAIDPEDWEILKKNFTSDEYYLSFENSNSMSGWFTYFVVGILIIGAVCFTIGLSYVLVQLLVLILIWIRESIVSRIQQVRRDRRRRLPASQLKKIPIQQWNSDMLQDICSICLDSFEASERVRILPCSHVFHQCCIDPWLLKQRRKCPNCKRKIVFPDENRDSDSSSDDERTPLLRRNSSTRESTTSPRHTTVRPRPHQEPHQQRNENQSYQNVPESQRSVSQVENERSSRSGPVPDQQPKMPSVSPNPDSNSFNSSANTSGEIRSGGSVNNGDIKGKVDQLCARMENVGRKIRKKVKTTQATKLENDSSSDLSTHIQHVLVSVTVEPTTGNKNDSSYDQPHNDESHCENQPSSSGRINANINSSSSTSNGNVSSNQQAGLQVKVVPDCPTASPSHTTVTNSEINSKSTSEAGGESSILSDLNA